MRIDLCKLLLFGVVKIMKSKKIITVVAAVVSVGFSALCAWYFTGFPKMYSGTPEKITIGKMPIESHALIYIAAIQGLLDNEVDSRFLNLHGISLQDVTRVDVQPSQFVDAITNGSVDAVIYIRQYNDAIKDRLGDNGVLFWPAQSSQLLYSVMVSRNDWIASHPETIKRFLKSLDQAEEYTAEHSVEAKAIIQKRLNYGDEARWTVNIIR